MTAPAFLALWNGVAPGHEAEYEAWHGIEHAPERLGAPGFRAAHRYRAEGSGPYFTLYELDGQAALATPAYAALMEHPTPWSARMRPRLTGFRRLPCDTLYARRLGLSGALATLRIGAPGAAALARLREALEAALAGGRILGATLGTAAGIGQGYAVFPGAPPPGEESLLLLHAGEPEALAPAVQACRAALAGLEVEEGRWRLLQSLRRDDLPDPHAARQAPRPELQALWP